MLTAFCSQDQLILPKFEQQKKPFPCAVSLLSRESRKDTPNASIAQLCNPDTGITRLVESKGKRDSNPGMQERTQTIG